MNNWPTLQWFINEIVIICFGFFTTLNGVRFYSDRLFEDYHYGVRLDLGEYHQIYGIIIMIIGIAIILYGIYIAINFYFRSRKLK